jgi:Cu(I)/Ag(I) efflux system membrane fusion protein
MNRPLQVCLLATVALSCFGLGAWYASSRTVAKSTGSLRRVLYYQDPMHPAYRSNSPGIAPDCGMEVEPVYEDSAPPGTIKLSYEARQKIGVRVALVEDASGASTSLRLLGRVAPDENRIYRLFASVDGWIRENATATTGSFVPKDHVLSTFYSPEFLSTEQAYLFSLGALDRFQSNSKETAEQIALTNTTIQRNVDTLRNLGMGELQIQEIRRTRALTDVINLCAPIPGFVLARNVSPGQRFEKGTELFRLADLSRVWIVADTLEEDVSAFRPGIRATVRYKGKSLPAKVSEVLPQFDAAARTLKVRLELDNANYLLRPDMFVDVELPVHLPDALTVPADAVVDSGRRTVVYVDRGEGVFEPRSVDVGWRYGDRVAITRGLATGERVVTGGTFLLDSESRLRLAAAEAPSTEEKDPVCGMTVKSAEHTAKVGRRTYRFCSAKCKRDFEANPEKYTSGGHDDQPHH